MSSNYIFQEHRRKITYKSRINAPNEISHLNRFNLNSQIKLNNTPHSLSQNKNLQYQQQNNNIPRIIQAEKIKNFNEVYEKENSKKSELNLGSALNNNIIEIKDLITKNLNKPIELSMLTEPILKFNQGKISSKTFGVITSYAANTNQGIVRNYNEDRVSIIINMNRPPTYQSSLPWPKISYFAIFDGHAGNKCAEFLRENLLKLICSSVFFPENIPESIKYGFEKADEIFLNNYAMVNGQLRDNSGTCGLILLIVNNEIFIGNVGDSRCIGSFNNGKIQRDITRDHKPNTPYEKERIILNGGQIYQTKTNIKIIENLILKNKILLGPHRVFPGRLSVSRTIGDAEGKIPILGGNPNVIISKPDIYNFNLSDNDIDYFILGCDGIYDQLTSKDVFKCVSIVLERNKELLKKMEYNDNNQINSNEYQSLYGNNIDIHTTCGDIVDLVLKAAMIRQSYDNVTCLLICFKNILNNDFITNYENTIENTRNRIEIYTSIKREPKILVTSNSSNNYHRTNSNNKKNINIHGISKIIQKLRSGNSDSSLFKKKEEMAIANEIKEYSGKLMMNIFNQNNNKNEKKNSISNIHSSQKNSNINISVDNNLNHSLNHTYNFKDEKRNIIFPSKNDENNNIQIIYKNINGNNFLYNFNNGLKSNRSNSINCLDKEELEDKKQKLFYNRKKINNNLYIQKNESYNFRNSDNLEKKKEIKIKNIKEINKGYIIKKKNNSRNISIYRNRPKKNIIINSAIYSNNNSFKNIHKNDDLLNNNNLLNTNKIVSTLKKFYKNKEEENYKANNNNNIINTNNNDIINKEAINNNFYTETKVKSKIFNNILKNTSNKINLFKDINIIKAKAVNTENLNENKNINKVNENENKDNFLINNKNTSFQSFKAFKPIGNKNIIPSSKINPNLKENKCNAKNKIVEYNNHKYYYSNSNSISKKDKNTKKHLIREKYDAFINANKSVNQFNESRSSKSKKYKELKVNNSTSKMRSNTEYNY